MTDPPPKPPRKRQYSDNTPCSSSLNTSSGSPGKLRPISIPSSRTNAAVDCIVQNLKAAINLEQSKNSHTNASLPHVANDSVPLRAGTESPGNEIIDDVLFQEVDVPVDEDSRPSSVFGNSDLGDELEGTRLPLSPRTKKQPMLPPTARSILAESSKMSPRVPRLRSCIEQEASQKANKVVPPSANGKRPVSPQVHTTQLSVDHKSSGSLSAEGPKKPSRPLLPPPRPIYRTVSKPEECTTSMSGKGSSHKPTPLPRLYKAMSVGAEEKTETNTSRQEPGAHTDTHFQPTSPAFSSSSGIVEDINSLPTSPNLESELCSPYSDRSSTTPTTLDPAAVSELPPDHPRASPPIGNMVSNESESETDKLSGRKVQKGRYYPKIQIKTDNSWINRSDSPTSPPSRRPPPAMPEGTSLEPIPYRSHPILSSSVDRQSCMPDVLATKSKPFVSSYGTYYPQATSERSVTPDPKLDSKITKESPIEIRKSKSSERLLLSVDDLKDTGRAPKRGAKAQRSISFRSANNKHPRPFSMMDDMSRHRNKEDLSANRTLPWSGTDEMKHLGKQKPEGNGKQPSSSPLQTRFGKLFKRTKTTAQVTDIPDPEDNTNDEQESGESSEDDIGGTIKRLPKLHPVPEQSDNSESTDGDVCTPEYPQLFEYVFVVGLKQDRSKKLSTEITYQFPPTSGDISKDVAIQSINQFCFPDMERWKPVNDYSSESYSFVLTSLEGNRRFGYCRRLLPEGKGARLPEVYCIISPLGCFDLYSKVLDHVEQRRAVSKAAVFTLLKSLIANPFPAPGRTVSVRVLPAKVGDMEVVKLTRPHDSRLEHVDFGELYNTLGPKRIIQVFSSLLMERRVILSAQRLSTLSSCCHALLALLYPFEWQHTFIPVLPSSLIDFCGSPLPFIIGINPSMAKQLDHLDVEMEEAVVVDLDKRSFLMRFGDESSILPNKLFQYLQHILEAPIVKSEYSKPSSSGKGNSRADEIVVDAFMTVFAYLYGNYRDFLMTTSLRTGTRKFQRNDFVKSFHSKSTQRFLEAFQMTQMFEMFIFDREDSVKAEAITKGLFEKKLPELKERVTDIELFSNKKNRFRLGKKKAVPVRL